MKRFLRRGLPVLAACILLLTACGRLGLSETGTGAPAGEGYLPGPFEAYPETVKVTAAVALPTMPENVEYQQRLWYAWYKKAINIDLEYVYRAPEEQYDQRVALMISSGDIPDIMTVKFINMQQMMQAELLESQTEPWETLISEDVREGMYQNGTTPFDVASVDGELYGIPWVLPAIESMHALLVNEQWRKKLGLAEPDTWENFEKMIYAFKENDPNGNGKADEFGLGLSKKLWDEGFEAASVANAFGAYPGAFIEKDGKVVYGSIQPEMKPALEKLARYYADGLIDPDFTEKIFDEEAELIARERLGAAFGLQWISRQGYCLETLYKNSQDPESLEFKTYPIPSVGGNPTKPVISDKTVWYCVVRKGYEHPDVMTRIVNTMFYVMRGPQETGPEGRPDLAISLQEYIGDAGQNNGLANGWTHQPFRPEAMFGSIERWKAYLAVAYENDREALAWCESGYATRINAIEIPNYLRDGIRMVDANGNTGIDRPAYMFSYMPCGQNFMIADRLRSEGNLVEDVRGAFISPTMTEKWSSLESMEVQEITKIITGDSPIEAFDIFVATWEANGGLVITEEMNEYHNSKGR